MPARVRPPLQLGIAGRRRRLGITDAGRGGRRAGGTVAGLNESLLRQLYATPPPEFIAARNELVKQLRKGKQRDDATALAALRRPGWDDWALNAVAGTDGDVVAGFADAAAAVRDAQSAAIEGREGPDIRTSLRDLRDRSAELVRLADSALAGAGRQPTPGEINARLSEVATSDVAVAQLRAGVLGSGDAAPADLFGDLEPGPARAVAPARRTSAKKEAARPAKATAPERDAAAERAARQEAARRTEALAEANRLHAAAAKARRRAEAEVEKADAAVERARAALAGAEEALATARQELDAAVESEQAAADGVDAARAAAEG